MAHRRGMREAGRGEADAAALLAYVVPVLSGLAIYLAPGAKDKHLRFHSVQAIQYWVTALVFIYIVDVVFLAIPFAQIRLLLGTLLFLAWVYALYVGYRAMEGRRARIPLIGLIFSS